MSADPFDLARFVTAQAGVFEAIDELRTDRKPTHWMWFAFPQLRGVGHYPAARRFGIGSLDEASAYVLHPVLGPRFEAAVAVVEASGAADPRALFGSPDNLKFYFSMTLFAIAAPDGPYKGRSIIGARGARPADLGPAPRRVR